MDFAIVAHVNSAVRQAPRISPEDASRIASQLFSIAGNATPLPSERDQNFRIGDFVLKLSNPSESREFLDLQNDVLQLLARSGTGLEWPLVIGTAEAEGHIVRLVTWVPG